MFSANIINTGHNNTSGPTSLDKDWKFSTGDNVQSSPAVVNGTVFVGSNDGNLYALDSQDGTKFCQKSLGSGGIQSSPAVMNGTVYVGTNFGDVFALDATDCSVKWSTEVGFSVKSSPAVVNIQGFPGDTVYIGGGWSNRVCALDAQTGDVIWKFPPTPLPTEVGPNDDNITGIMRSSPAVVTDDMLADVNATVFIGDRSSRVYALNARTGAPRWVFDTSADDPNDVAAAVVSSPAVANRTVYVGNNNGEVYALDVNTGALRPGWPVDFSGIVRSSPAIVNGTVYVGWNCLNLPCAKQKIRALDAQDGTVKGEFETDGTNSSPAVAEGKVYVGSSDGNVYILNANSHKIIDSYSTGGPVTSSPAVVNDTVYIGSDDKNVYALV